MVANGSMDARAPGLLREARETLPLGVTLLAAAVLCFLSGGYFLSRSGPVVVGYLLGAVVCVWLAVRWDSPSRLMLLALGLFFAFAAWTGVSLMWSLAPDRSWLAFNVTALYVAVTAFVGLSSVRRGQLRTGAWVFLAAGTAVAVGALLDKTRLDLSPIASVEARISGPVGYWNGLALLMIMALLVGLALAVGRTSLLPLRVVAAAAGVPMLLAFFLTFSRGGWVVLAVALLVYFGLADRRLVSFLTLLCIVGTSAALLYRLRGSETLFAATTNDALRVAQTQTLLRWAIVAVVVTAGLQALLVMLERRVPWPRRAAAVAGGVVLVALVVGVAITGSAFLARHGGASWISDRVGEIAKDNGRGTTSDVGRLTSANTGRPPLWREAVRQWETHPITGGGAGTFVLTHYRFRTVATVVKDAHSEWFSVLGGLGLVGLLLFVAAMAALFVTAARSLWSCRADPSRTLLVAMFAGAVAFTVHISVDWQWNMTGIGVSAFALLAAVIAYGRSASVVDEPLDASSGAAPSAAYGGLGGSGAGRSFLRGWRIKTVASAALVVLALSWLLPYLSVRATDEARLAVGQGRPAAAAALSKQASGLDPLAVNPLFTEAQALKKQGRNGEAVQRLQAAARLQPGNYEVWFQLGLFQATTLGDKPAALASFRRALALNPLDPSTLEQIKLVER